MAPLICINPAMVLIESFIPLYNLLMLLLFDFPILRIIRQPSIKEDKNLDLFTPVLPSYDMCVSYNTPPPQTQQIIILIRLTFIIILLLLCKPIYK